MKRHTRWIMVLALLLAAARPVMAIKPIVSGDVPTAPKGVYEVFLGYLLVDNGATKVHQIPFWEVVYGLTERQELTIEGPVVYRDDPPGSSLGIGDVVLGTKYRFLGEPAGDTGLSASLEVKLPTGDSDRRLGSGTTDVALLTRCGWMLGREVVYFNLGYTWLGEPRDESVDDTWFYSGVWDHPVGDTLRLLTEVLGSTSEDPDGSNRLAASIGIKWKVLPSQQFHFAAGRSLRAHAEGGPDLRLYTGWRWDF